MSEERRRKNLGRGLDALLGEDSPINSADRPSSDSRKNLPVTSAPVEKLVPGTHQPRRQFDSTELKSLAESIKANGIIQPILVRKRPDGSKIWEIVAGERRWRAAQMAQLHEVPILVRDLTDSKALEIALVENLQRENLSPLEEAKGYRRLIHEFSHTQGVLGELLGKSRSHVANMIRLLSLPDDVKLLVDSGILSAGHARALINVNNPADLAKIIVKKGLNVRQTEKLASKFGVKSRKHSTKQGKDADTLALEKDLSRSLGLMVSIDFRGSGGKITINYNTLEQLDGILNRLKQNDVTANSCAEQSTTVSDPFEFPDTFNGNDIELSGTPSDDITDAIEELEAGAEIPEVNKKA